MLFRSRDLGLQSIAFPAISCGVYGWSPVEAAPIAVGAVRDWVAMHGDSSVVRVRFMLFNEAALEAFRAAAT
mgnify:CR=1 FL=1